MKKGLFIILIICAATVLKAQNNDSLYSKKYIQKINIISPSIEGELLFSSKNNITFNYIIGIKPKFQFLEKNSWSPSNTFNEFYYLSIEIRNYVNSSKRLENMKRVDKFSGAYGSIKLEAGSAFQSFENITPNYIEFGPMIGFQRAIGKIWYWDINAGVGPNLNNNFFAFSFFGSAKFGFAF